MYSFSKTERSWLLVCNICDSNSWREHTAILFCVSEIRNRRLQFEALQHLIQLLPVPNRDTLWALLNFLVTVARNAGDYKDETGNVKLDCYDTCCISCVQYHKMRYTTRHSSSVTSVCLSATVPKHLEWCTYSIYYWTILISLILMPFMPWGDAYPNYTSQLLLTLFIWYTDTCISVLTGPS
jgi:hypothetical protein